MKYPSARRDGVYSEVLGSETIVYDKLNHRAHSLNKTVALVWKSADGGKSIAELAGILHRELDIPADAETVLLALEELKAAGLLDEVPEAPAEIAAPSRREVARRFALAGASAALVPFMASVLAPTPAMASSGSSINPATAKKDLESVTNQAYLDPAYYVDKTAQQDLSAAQTAYDSKNYATEVTDLDGTLSALGLPPLS